MPEMLAVAARMAWHLAVWPVAALVLVALALATTPLLLYQLARGLDEGPADRLVDAVMPGWSRIVTPWEVPNAS